MEGDGKEYNALNDVTVENLTKLMESDPGQVKAILAKDPKLAKSIHGALKTGAQQKRAAAAQRTTTTREAFVGGGGHVAAQGIAAADRPNTRR